jgi:hypothetical protein
VGQRDDVRPPGGPVGLDHSGMRPRLPDVKASLTRRCARRPGARLATAQRAPSSLVALSPTLGREDAAGHPDSGLAQRRRWPASSRRRDPQLGPTRTPPSTAVAWPQWQAPRTPRGPRVGGLEEATSVAQGHQASTADAPLTAFDIRVLGGMKPSSLDLRQKSLRV